MNTTQTSQSSQSTTAPRRLRYGLSAVILLLAVSVSCVIASAMATRWSVRIDVTATREHTLSPRTLSLLEALDDPTEIVIVTDFASLDPRATLHMREVLDGFDRNAPQLAVTEIDLGAADGRPLFTELLARLASSIEPQITEHVATLKLAVVTTHNASAELRELSTGILTERAKLDAGTSESENLDRIAAATRLLAGSIEEALAEAQDALDQSVGGAQIPAVDIAALVVASIQRALLVDLDAIDNALSSLSFNIAGANDVNLGDASDALLAMRDSIARSADTVDRLIAIQSLAAIRTIESGAGAVVISGENARAVPMRALFPPAALLDSASGGAADIRFVGESLLAAAIGSLTGAQSAPIVVLVHGAGEHQLDDDGRAITQDADRAFGSLLESLRLRDMRIAEWAPGTGTPRPTFAASEGEQERPVVWVTFPVSMHSAEGAKRMGQHASAVKGLIESGANVLLSFDTSTLPGVGEPDPMVEPLDDFGISVRTGAAMLRRANTPSGPIVDGQFVIRSAEATNPIGRAIDGLSTRLAWPCPIETIEHSGVTLWPLLIEPDSDQIWGEMEWMAFRSLSPAQRSMLADAPTPDPGTDLTDGPWTLAIAAERPAPDGASEVQRIVVVGANGWFTDVVTRNSTTIDGRTVSANPGNAEFFEASVAWLAHQDDTIGTGPRASEIPRIPAISAWRLTMLRWGIIIGMPLLVLLTGVVLRLWRG